MSHTKRIVFWTIFLIGSVILFYFWAIHQMFAIKQEEITYVESLPVVLPFTKIAEVESNFYTIATSSSMQIVLEKNLDTNEWSSSTLKISSTTIDSTDFNFIFPDEKKVVYQNCTYDVDLNLGDTIKPNYIGVVLADAGTQEVITQKDSGLLYSLTFKDNRFKWSVGNVWPGEYYLSIPLIDGHEVVVKSKKFLIKEKRETDVCEK